MKKKSDKKRGLWSILNGINFEIFFSMFLSALSAISLIISLTLISYTLTYIYERQPISFFNIEMNLINTIIVLSIFVVVSFLSRFAAFVVSHLGAFKLEQSLRIKLSLHLAKVPLGYVISSGSGSLKKVMQNDVRGLHAFVADSIPMISKSAIAPIVSFLILMYVDYRLALASLIVLFLGALIMFFVMKDSSYYREEYEKSQTKINKAVIEFSQAMPVVRTFDDGSSSFSKYIDALISYRDNLNIWMEKTSFSGKLGTVILTPLPTLICVIITGIYFMNTGTMHLSSFILALFLSTGMADSFMPLMWLQNFIKKSQASAIRIQEVLDIEELPEVKEGRTPNNNSISFENVSFSYDGADKKSLDNISFKIPSKSVTALVGPSGAGKSTIAKLIPRFWDIQSGCIKIGDVDIKHIKQNVLMEIVSFVFQDTFLFNDTLFNNIKMAKPEASKDEVIQAAKAAQIHDYIRTLPNTYETKAGDRGTNLSGGQKQRITIARAILRNNPILILDEATAFADPENEEEIIKALANLMKDKTVIIIAHRLSTIKDADQIIVIDDGKVKESGTHTSLLKNNQTYSSLWANYEKAQEWNLELKENYESK